MATEQTDLEKTNDFLTDLYARRGTAKIAGNPVRFLERIAGATMVEVTAFEPDPTTYRHDYYYNAITNRLYKKIVVERRPELGVTIAHWKPVSV